MAHYYDNAGEICTIDLLKFNWEIVPVHGKKGLKSNFISIKTTLRFKEVGSNEVFRLTDENVMKLYFSYSDADLLKFRPLADYLAYPVNKNGIYSYERLELDQLEKEYFTGLLDKEIGDHHSQEMQKTMMEYHNAVDPAVRQFVLDVVDGNNVNSVVVGHVDARMGEDIKRLTGIECSGNAIVLNADDVRHIIKRHGPNGQADHSMADVDNIARIGYVLNNYDEIYWDGTTSAHHYLTKENEQAPYIQITKHIDGDYFIVEVASDGKKKRNVVITAFLKKRKELSKIFIG